MNSLFRNYTKSDPIPDYGQNIILRKYLCVPKWLPLIAFMEHGWTPLDGPLKSDLGAEGYPLMFVYSKRRLDAYKNVKHNLKKVFVLGMPFILYRMNRKITKKKDAKGTIAFPSHGTDLIKNEYNIKKYCQELNDLSPEFHPITICLHCDDISQKESYNTFGFNVVTNGPRYEPSFVDNFYNIIKSHKYAVSNIIGSHTFYSIDLNIPFFILGEEPVYINHLNRDPNVPAKYKPSDFMYGKEAYELFNTGPVTNISEEQKKYVERETGIKDAHNRIIPIIYYWFYFLKWIFTKIFRKLLSVKNIYNYLTSISYRKIIKQSNKRLKLALYDYKRLSKPFKKYRTNEIWYYNEVYGFSYILKKYAGYKDDYMLKFIATHGVRYRNLTGSGFSWEFDQNAPMIFTNSDFAIEIVEKFIDKTVKVIPGSLQILYANRHLNHEQFASEKLKLGKNLLVFPAHTSSSTNPFYDFSNFINEIQNIRKNYNFNSVTICLYFRDIARGFDKKYFGYNFNITCAGHISDCNFFPRLRTIIELSDVVMANSDTSAMWYSLSLGKPFYFWNDDSMRYENSVHIDDPEFGNNWYKLHKESEEITEIRKTFSEYTEYITEDQKILIDRYCDTKHLKSPEEMRKIFDESEQMYLSGNYKKYEKNVITDKMI
jgi:hypothetical protein